MRGWVVRHPDNSPSAMTRAKAAHSTSPSIPTTHLDHTAASPDLIVDLENGPEDSEYEDFEDELDV